MKELRILAAKDGGYIVVEPGDGYFNQPLFAGPLPEALDYVRNRFVDNREAAK